MKNTERTGNIYLLHLDSPLGHSRHYIGFTKGEVEKRIEQHRKGRGAALLREAGKRGIGFKLVRTWENVPFSFERELKRSRNGPRFCPQCNSTHALTNKSKGKAIIKESF